MSEVKKLIFKMKNEQDYETRVALEECLVNMFDDKDAEIEQLKKRISWLESGSIHTCHAECEKPLCVANREIEKLQLENAELKEELKQVLSIGVKMQREVNRKLSVKYDNLKQALDVAIDNLTSISKNSCCDQCQQAKLVAASALQKINTLTGGK